MSDLLKRIDAELNARFMDTPNAKALLTQARAEIARLRKRPVIETGEPPRDETVVYVQVSVPVRWDFGAGEWVSVPPHMKFPDMPPALWTREPMRGE